jgi:radical SAM superfamily enzyme YgiQ (UPF0313 family)
MRVILINPQFFPGYIHSARWDSVTYSNTHWYPILLAYCTGLLEKHKHNCKLVDAEAENLNDKQVLEIANKFKPDFTVIYITERGLKANIRLAENIKNSTKSKIIFVGPWCSIVPKEILKCKLIDFIIDGEFDYATLKVVEGKIKGKRYIKAPRLTAKQLNDLEWVTKVYKKHLNVYNYRVSSIKYPYIDVFTGRKCYWSKCIFCLWPFTVLEGGGYITRDLEDVLDEIEWASKNLPIKEIFIQDDTLPGERAKQLAEGILKRRIKINWACYARGDLSHTPEIVKLMKKSGCHCVHIGFESGSNDMLKIMCKGVTVENLKTVSNRFKEAGITVHGDFMIGLPGETEKTVRQTIDFAKSLDIETYQFAPPKVYMCTPLYNWFKNNNDGAYLDDGGYPNLKNMTYEQMVKWCKIALKESYLNRNFLRRALFHPSEFVRISRNALPVLKFMFSSRKEMPEECKECH